MSTASTIATLAASPTTSRTSALSGCLSATTLHEKEVDPFGLLRSGPSSSGRKRKHMEHRDIERHSKRHARSRSALKLRIVRTALGYKAFPAAESVSFEIAVPVQPSPRATSTLPAHDVVHDPGHGQHIDAYANKIRIVRGEDGEYKAYPPSSAPPTPTESFHSTSAA